jgi:hypothetical protein
MASLKEESSFVPASPCPMGIGLLALRTDTLFTPVLKGTGVSIYLNTILVLFHFDSKELISMIGGLITKYEQKVMSSSIVI